MNKTIRLVPVLVSRTEFPVWLLGLAFFALLVQAGGTAARAEEERTNENSARIQTTAVSTSSAPATGFSAPLDHLYVNYFATFHGSPLNDLGSPQTPDRNGVVNSKSYNMNLDGELITAYLFSENYGLGPVLPFIYSPVEGGDMILGDVGIKAFDRKTVSYGGFSLATNIILQTPSSRDSRNRGMDGAIKTTPALRFAFPKSRFAMGAWTELKEYFGVFRGKTFKAWAGPYVSYQIAKNLLLNLEYEMEWHHDVGQSSGSLAVYQTDLQPGVVWKLSPRFMINPYVQIFTTQNTSMDSMAVGAVMSATIL